MMYQGNPSKGLEFYNLLNQSDEFTSELGKVTLASAKLEAEIILLLDRKGIGENHSKSTLGTLIRIAKKHKFFSKNEILCFSVILEQRNYITHNIYALFIDLIQETIFPKENLLDSDVHTYMEIALELRENLDGLAEVIKSKK